MHDGCWVVSAVRWIVDDNMLDKGCCMMDHG